MVGHGQLDSHFRRLLACLVRDETRGRDKGRLEGGLS
jgi:hypothetical protein